MLSMAELAEREPFQQGGRTLAEWVPVMVDVAYQQRVSHLFGPPGGVCGPARPSLTRQLRASIIWTGPFD